MRAAVLSVALIGCAYSPGSFSHFRHGFPGQRTTVGCLDLSVERRPDLIGGGTVLGYNFGNRCDRPATVDLSRVSVVGRTWEGQEVTLYAFDPNAQLRELQLDGRAAGFEAIAYPADEKMKFSEICVDVATVAHTSPAQWLCFASKLPPSAPGLELMAEVSR